MAKVVPDMSGIWLTTAVRSLREDVCTGGWLVRAQGEDQLDLATGAIEFAGDLRRGAALVGHSPDFGVAGVGRGFVVVEGVCGDILLGVARGRKISAIRGRRRACFERGHAVVRLLDQHLEACGAGLELGGDLARGLEHLDHQVGHVALDLALLRDAQRRAALERVLAGLEARADEQVVLFVETRQPLSANKLRRALEYGDFSIDREALPDRIEFRTLPRKGRQNKVDKIALREISTGMMNEE